MGVSISYDADSRMIFSGLSCSCSLEHSTPRQDIYVGQRLIGKVPHFIRRRGLGARCVLVCDNNTYEVAGRNVEAALCADGFSVTLCRVVREGKMVPDETAVGEVVLSLAPDTEFLVAVGSGSVTDITRVTAKAAKLPFVSVGTAPSMDGYTSVVAPLIFRGAKIHRKANCPEIIVCDLDVMSRAPEGMFISGVGDVLGKCIAKADWVLGSIINDEVCREASRLEILRRYYAAQVDVARGVADACQLRKLELVMQQADVTPELCPAIAAANQKAEETDAPAGAMMLPDGRVVTGKTSSLLGASAALLLNALKAMAGIRSDLDLISNQVIEPISALKIQSLGHHNPRLHSDEVLIALAISGLTNPLADMARDQLGSLRGCDAHFSVIISEEDIKLYKRLGIHVSCEPKYESKRLYHK